MPQIRVFLPVKSSSGVGSQSKWLRALSKYGHPVKFSFKSEFNDSFRGMSAANRRWLKQLDGSRFDWLTHCRQTSSPPRTTFNCL